MIIKLGCTGTISGFDIDTTGFTDAAPTNVLVEGYVESKNHDEKVTKKKTCKYLSNSGYQQPELVDHFTS